MIADINVAKRIIAKRIAKEIHDGDVVNLGIGLPTLVPNYIEPGIMVTFQSENGMLGMGPRPEMPNPNITDAGGNPSSMLPHGCFFDSAMSFAMIRGGHVDVCVLGSLEVDETGSIANWIIPGKMVPGMGGAMDLLVGARRVIVSMLHTAGGQPKILKRCTLPLTAKHRVEMIVTELGIMEIVDRRIVLREVFAHSSVEEIAANTGAEIIVCEDLKVIDA